MLLFVEKVTLKCWWQLFFLSLTCSVFCFVFLLFLYLTDNFGRFQNDDDWRSRVAQKVDTAVLQSPDDGWQGKYWTGRRSVGRRRLKTLSSRFILCPKQKCYKELWRTIRDSGVQTETWKAEASRESRSGLCFSNDTVLECLLMIHLWHAVV